MDCTDCLNCFSCCQQWSHLNSIYSTLYLSNAGYFRKQIQKDIDIYFLYCNDWFSEIKSSLDWGVHIYTARILEILLFLTTVLLILVSVLSIHKITLQKLVILPAMCGLLISTLSTFTYLSHKLRNNFLWNYVEMIHFVFLNYFWLRLSMDWKPIYSWFSVLIAYAFCLHIWSAMSIRFLNKILFYSCVLLHTQCGT